MNEQKNQIDFSANHEKSVVKGRGGVEKNRGSRENRTENPLDHNSSSRRSSKNQTKLMSLAPVVLQQHAKDKDFSESNSSVPNAQSSVKVGSLHSFDFFGRPTSSDLRHALSLVLYG
jgi:hypothetical protein